MTPLFPARAVEMQKTGMSTVEIGRELGVSPQQVWAWFRDLGYDAWEYHGDTIAAMYVNGAAYADIAAVTGLEPSSGSLTRVLEPRGVRRRTVSEAVALRYERERRASGPLVCNRCTILLDAERESGMCTDCERELVSGRLAMAPTEFTLMAEAMEGVR